MVYMKCTLHSSNPPEKLIDEPTLSHGFLTSVQSRSGMHRIKARIDEISSYRQPTGISFCFLFFQSLNSVNIPPNYLKIVRYKI